MVDFIEKGPTDCWLWQKDSDSAPNKVAKMACDNPLCCNPRHIVKKQELSIDLLVDAIAQLDPANPEHYSGGGKPKPKALKAITGLSDITAEQRDEAFQRYQDNV